MTMVIDPFTTSKRPRSSMRMRIVTRSNPRAKKKENSPTDVPVVVSERDYDTEPEEDDYMITVDK
jgi:hypothetical protein